MYCFAVDPKHGSATGRTRSQRPQRSLEVADALRARIRSGELRAGQRMPTQARLADEFGVERGAVREALRILQSEHLLANVSKGSPATVVGDPSYPGRPAGPAAPPLPTTVALAPRVATAFDAPHVEIDALCLTSVSLNLALGEPLWRIHAGQLKPAKVDVRVLLPSRDIDLAFPTLVEAAPGNRLRRHWLAQRNAQGQVLRHNLLALRATHGIDVRVTFRALPFTPPVKLYLLNGAEALFAFYTLSRSEREVDHEQLQLYDVEGTRSMLFAFERGAGVRDTTFVEQSRRWFDALWRTISTDLQLGD
ncbi:GntR family transcriptional regulator [Streptomyces griseoviridis]|uniref:GntR family transcriptional regulator n=2 Tax=Streptomyces TaxID=1883 RepID=A0A3Q9KX60_STRGD|nr:MULTISPECIES: winged helix-turn-helix domain-containing protein [Streptomyces]AZS86415.1 GntR family transcriptional regulator [Streptomyces griseoviridis]MDT0476089.1 winged helix-turn-helix domain-containing protein [Streptomyces sp. DSM 41014]QCN86721.1 GntR family transcriptional regulator [Streptomyces griseoviridis]